MKRAFPFFGLILILIWVIACTVPESKATPTPGAIVLSDQEGWYPLGLHLEMLEDLSRNLSITQVSAPGMNAQFSPNKKATPSFGVTHSTIWARFRIDDQSQTTPYWLLAIGLPSMEHIDLFVSQKEGNFLIQRTGLLIPDSAQEIQDNHYVFKLPAGLQEGQVVYLRFETTNTMTLPLTLWSPEAFNQKERYEELMWGMFLGLMLGMAVFNSLLFLVLRDSNFLTLVFYIAAILANAAMQDGHIKDILSPDLGFQYQYLQPLFTAPKLVMFLLFAYNFLKIRRLSPRLSQVFFGFFVVLAVFMVLIPILDRSIVTILFLILSIPSIALVIVSGLIALKNGYRPARYYLIAQLIPLLILFGDPLSRLGLLPGVTFFSFISNISDGTLVTVLALALADRINYHKQLTKAAADKLRESEAISTQFLNSQPFGVMVYGQDKKLRFINQTARTLFNLPDDSLELRQEIAVQRPQIYKSKLDIPILAEDRPLIQALAGRASHFEDVEVEIRGRRVPLDIQTKPIYNADGSVAYVISVFQDISLRRQREQEIRIAQELYRSVVENQTYLICRFRPDGTLTFVNQAYCDYFGSSRDELVGSNLFTPILESDRSLVRSQLDQIKTVNPVGVIENRIVNCSGQIRWLRWTNQCFFGIEGNPTEYQATGRDISEQKFAEDQLALYRDQLEDLVAARTRQEQRQRQIAESLQEIGAILNSSLDRETVLAKILEQLRRVIEYNGAALFLVEGEELVLVDAVGSSRKMIGTQISIDAMNYPVDTVLLKRSPQVIAITTSDPRWVGSNASDNTLSWLGAPLIANDRVVGLLIVDSTLPEKYTEVDLPVVQAFANHAAIAVVNAELHRRAQMAAVVEERNRIAGNLHDAVTQTLFSASLIAEALPLQWEQDEAGARENLAKLNRLNRSALAEMRMLLLELRPVSFQKIRLGTLIGNLCEAYQVQIGAVVDLKMVDQNSDILPLEVKEYFYRTTQEALNNIVKHASATQVQVIFEHTYNQVLLCIQDNGRGFDLTRVSSDHLGLQIMRERAAKVNASLQIEPQPNQGTLILSEWKKSHE